MAFTADNAVILAAGFASRFVPLSFEKPKGLLRVHGEVLVERQIRQLREAGIDDIFVVTGYKAEQFAYLKDQLGVTLVHNPDFSSRNNHSSIWAVRDVLRNTYVCSSDNYFTENPFTRTADDAYYAGAYAAGETPEWCMTTDENGYIDSVRIGGCDAWYMLGHTFWSAPFSRAFIHILESVYDDPQTKKLLWEGIYIQHLDALKMKMRPYPAGIIYEFDSLDELRAFDPSYQDDTHCTIIHRLAQQYGCSERELTDFCPGTDDPRTFTFCLNGVKHCASLDAFVL